MIFDESASGLSRRSLVLGFLAETDFTAVQRARQCPVRCADVELVAAVLAQEEEVRQGGLDEEDGGDAEGELAMLGFVAKEVHTQEGADAAAGNGQPDESVFGDSPLTFLGLPFVDAVDEEGQYVDADEVDDEVSHGGTCAYKLEFTRLLIYQQQTVPLL